MIKSVWSVLDQGLSAITLKNFQTPRLVWFNQLNDAFHGKEETVILITVSELRHISWLSRNEAKLEKRIISPDVIEKRFKYALQLRIRADHVRLPASSFEDIWCQNNVLAEVDDKNTLVIGSVLNTRYLQ